MPTRKEQKEQRRKQLLQVALDEFVDKGFYGTSTNAIAARCKISTGLMFHYFDSKEALYVALIERAAEQMGALGAAVPQGAGPLEAFEKMVAFTLQMFATSPEACKTFVFMKQVMLSHLKLPGAEEALQKMGVIESLAGLVRAGQLAGEIRAGEPMAMTTLFFASLQGVGEMAYRYPHLPLPHPGWLVSFMRQ